MSDRAAYDRLQALGRPAERVLSVLDLARTLARRTGDLAPLLRALSVEPVTLSRAPDGSVETVTDGQLTCVCAWSSPARLMAATAYDVDQLALEQARLSDLAAALPDGTGVLLDARTEAAVLLEPPHLREVRALAAGIATRSALHPVEGERLLLDPGPPTRTPLDEQVALLAPGASRAVARLDGVGGRDWPVYYVDDEQRRAVLDAVGPGTVLVGRTAPPALEAGRSLAVALRDLPDDRSTP